MPPLSADTRRGCVVAQLAKTATDSVTTQPFRGAADNGGMGNEHEETRSPYEPVKSTLDGAGTAHTAFDLMLHEDAATTFGEMFSGEASLAKGVLGGVN